MDNNPISCHLLGRLYTVDGKQLQQQYKDHLSDFHNWEQKDHADEWMLFEDNIGPSLSIDETALSNGELYTIITNKEAKGGKSAIVAMLKGTQAEQIMTVLERIPVRSGVIQRIYFYIKQHIRDIMELKWSSCWLIKLYYIWL